MHGSFWTEAEPVHRKQYLACSADLSFAISNIRFINSKTKTTFKWMINDQLEPASTMWAADTSLIRLFSIINIWTQNLRKGTHSMIYRIRSDRREAIRRLVLYFSSGLIKYHILQVIPESQFVLLAMKSREMHHWLWQITSKLAIIN